MEINQKSPSQFHFLNATDPLNIFEVYVSITKSEKQQKLKIACRQMVKATQQFHHQIAGCVVDDA